MKHYTEDEIDSIAGRATADAASLTLDEIEALGASRLALVRRPKLSSPGAHACYNYLMWSGYPRAGNALLTSSAEPPPNAMAEFLRRG